MSTNFEMEITTKIKDEIQETITTKPVKFKEKLKSMLSNITVEPLIILTIFSSMTYQLATQNLLLEKACRASLNFNETICDALTNRDTNGYTSIQEAEVQKLTSEMLAIKTSIKGFFPLIISLFVGSWSDRHNKRRVVVLTPVIGELLCCVFLIINTIFFYQLPIVFTALSEVLPMSLLGGWPCLFVGVYSYVSSISTKETKTLRIGSVSTSHTAAMLMGYVGSGVMLETLGFLATFSLCTFLIFLAFIFGYFTIKDVQLNNNQNNEKSEEVKKKKGPIRDFFDIKNFLKTFKTCFGSNENNRRWRMVAIMLLSLVGGGSLQGENTVSYIYTRYKFGWNAVQFSMFMAVHFIGHVIANFFSLVVLSKYLHWEDATLGMISMISSMIGSGICALAPYGEFFYLGGLMDCFFFTSLFATRSLLAKTLPPNEQGQANSVFGIGDALTPLLFGPLYSIFYEKTITIFPGAFYFISVLVKFVGLCLYGFLYMETIKDKRKAEHKASL